VKIGKVGDNWLYYQFYILPYSSCDWIFFDERAHFFMHKMQGCGNLEFSLKFVKLFKAL